MTETGIYNIRHLFSVIFVISVVSGSTLWQDACQKLTHYLVTSRLDCGNARRHDLTSTLTERLQTARNPSAWLVARICKRQHMTPALNSVHGFQLCTDHSVQDHATWMYSPKWDCRPVLGWICCCLPPNKIAEIRVQRALLTVPQTGNATRDNRCRGKAAATPWNNQKDTRYL